MAKVILGVTGSVAALRTPVIYDLLQTAGHQVRIVATTASLYFFDPIAFAPLKGPGGIPSRNPEVVTFDEDEWPGIDQGRRWQRNEPVLHVELRRWADLLLIAPLDANTLAKLALGLTDNCLACVARAWDRTRPVVVAPAMNTFMWQHPATTRHLNQLAEDYPRLAVAPTVVKELACHDVGDGAMAEPEDVVALVAASLASPTR